MDGCGSLVDSHSVWSVSCRVQALLVCLQIAAKNAKRVNSEPAYEVKK